jgi:hypothetical protein
LWDEYALPGYTKDNTIILDDFDEVHKTQPGNCVIAVPFEFTSEGSENDDYFERIKPYLEKFRDGKLNRPAHDINSALKLLPATE